MGAVIPPASDLRRSCLLLLRVLGRRSRVLESIGLRVALSRCLDFDGVSSSRSWHPTSLQTEKFNDWLRDLANVNELCTKHLRCRRRLVMQPGICWWIAVLVRYAKWSYWPCDLLIPKVSHFRYIPRSFPIPSLNTLESFVSELCCGETDKQMAPNVLRTPTTSI